MGTIQGIEFTHVQLAFDEGFEGKKANPYHRETEWNSWASFVAGEAAYEEYSDQLQDIYEDE